MLRIKKVYVAHGNFMWVVLCDDEKPRFCSTFEKAMETADKLRSDKNHKYEEIEIFT